MRKPTLKVARPLRDVTIFDNIDPNLKAKFKEYHRQNPEFWKLFRQYCQQMKSSGRKRYSARYIIDRIRWDMDIKSGGEVFKYNDMYTALYARLMVYHYPEFDGFFELRAMKPFGRKISGEQRSREAAMGNSVSGIYQTQL